MSREHVIGRIRTTLGASREPIRARAVTTRLAAPPLHPRPAFAALTGVEREERLMACLEAQGTTVVTVPDLQHVPAAVETLLLPAKPANGSTRMRLVMADDLRLRSLSWPGGIAPERWTAEQTLGDGHAALTHALAAVAETGTLILVSSAASPASLAFLPEVHLVAVARETVEASFEDVFARLSAIGPLPLPRAINLVSGPSRTGDIGGRIVKGAHGPRRLCVILYGPLPSSGLEQAE